MIKKIKDEYFVDSIFELRFVEKELNPPLPIKIIDSNALMKEPPCVICGGMERRDLAIACVDGDWKRWICYECVEKHMPDLLPTLKKLIEEMYLELKVRR